MGNPACTLHLNRGATLARLGIGSVAGNREILVPLAKQLEDRHLSPMHNTPPDHHEQRQMQLKRRMHEGDDGEIEIYKDGLIGQ